MPDGEITGGMGGDKGRIKPVISPDGEITGEIKILHAIETHPGIKREGLLLETQIPLRTIDRILQRLKKREYSKIEYRGSKKTGGWFIKS